MTKRVNRIISGALILTLAGILSKVLSAMYRIPLQNLTGDLGFYTYQQIYPLIATVTILALYGFPLAVSKITAEQLQTGKKLSYRSYFIPVFSILVLVNGLFSLVIFVGAPVFANWMQDSYLLASLRLGSLLFLLIPFLALFRGVFQAELQMNETAYSQVIEQLIRVMLIITSAILIFQGILDVREIAYYGVLSSLVGMLASVFFLAYLFIRRYPFYKGAESKTTTIPWKYYVKMIVLFGIFAAFNHLTLIFIQVIDVFTLVPQLIKSGIERVEAMELKGVFDRGIPLIQFGAVLGSSFALAFVPSIAQQTEEEQRESIQDAMAVTVYVALGATIGLISIFEEVNILLFKDALGTKALQVLTLAILLLSLSITTNAILQAYGKIGWTLFSLGLSLLMKIWLNYLFIPGWEIYGSAFATLSSLFVLTSLSIYGIYRHVRFSPWHRLRPLPLLSATMGMAIYLKIVRFFIPVTSLSRLMLLIYVLFLVMSGALLYLIILLRYDALKERQIKALPFGQGLLLLRNKIGKNS